MKYLLKIFIPIIIFSIIGISCSTVAITGRKQLNIIPDSEMLSMSFQQYDEFIKTNKLSADKNNTNMIKRAGSNIQNAKICRCRSCFPQRVSLRLPGY